MQTVTTEQTVSRTQVLQAQRAWAADPLKFSQQFFGTTLWVKQQEIMLAVKDYSRVAVKSGNTIGKSHSVAEIVLWFLISHYPSKVVMTAPTWNQIENILWKEIASLYRISKIPIGAQLLNTELKFNEEWFAIGISTNDVNSFQGFHSPYLLVIIEEALGVAPEIWEAIESLHPYRVLAIGNPLDPAGNFFACFSSPAWHKITVSCEECVEWQEKHGRIPGLVDRTWIDERREEWGVKSPLYQARVLGEFPQEGTDSLIHMKWVEQARTRTIDEDEQDEGVIKIVAGDVARYGADKTVILDRKGHTVDSIEIKEKIPTTMTTGILKRHYERYGADSLVVDDDGVGGGVVDMLSEMKIGVLGFKNGSKERAIDHNHYKNLRSQFYYIMAKKFEKGLYSLKKLNQREYELLKSQLCSIKYFINSDGKIQVESKDDMRARGLPSPDCSDVLMMSEYAYHCGKMGDMRPFRYS